MHFKWMDENTSLLYNFENSVVDSGLVLSQFGHIGPCPWLIDHGTCLSLRDQEASHQGLEGIHVPPVPRARDGWRQFDKCGLIWFQIWKPPHWGSAEHPWTALQPKHRHEIFHAEHCKVNTVSVALPLESHPTYSWVWLVWNWELFSLSISPLNFCILEPPNISFSLTTDKNIWATLQGEKNETLSSQSIFPDCTCMPYYTFFLSSLCWILLQQFACKINIVIHIWRLYYETR